MAVCDWCCIDYSLTEMEEIDGSLCCESCAGHEYDESEESLTCEGCGKALYLNGETLCSMCAEAGPLS